MGRGRPRSTSRRSSPFPLELLASIVLILAPAIAAAHTGQTPHVHAGMRWEQVLTSNLTYTNPYRHLLVQIQWTCLSGCDSVFEPTKLPKHGFWDGGANNRTFKIRALFPQPLSPATIATWRWATTCSRTPQGIAASEMDCTADGGLNSASASNIVTVAPSDGANGITNPLYIGGHFWLAEGNASENGQLIRGNIYLATPYDVPFYWLGDTAWAAPVRAKFDAATTPNCGQASGWSTNDWKCYVQDRVSRGFSVLQIAVPQWWMKNPLQDSNNQAPFVASSAFPAWAKWNPAFWKGFEDKVQYANERGLVVVVVGLMEPSYQFLAINSPSFGQRYPPLEDAKTFARNLSARLAGNFVILSPGFDTRPDGGARSDLIRAVGAEIDATLPRHRVVNHFGGSTPLVAAGAWNDYQDFAGEPWLDFHLFQSGQCNNLSTGGAASLTQQLQNFTNRARQMPLDLRTYPQRKASENGEAIYDFEGAVLEQGQSAPENAIYYRPYRVRQTAYLSTLSGAFGYTLGVYGLWDWGLGDGAGPYLPRTPRASVGQTSVLQMQLLASFFRMQRWHWLAPAPTLIRNNPVEPDPNNFHVQHLQMVVSRDLTRRSTMAYLPDNAAIHLQLNSILYPNFTTARWSKLFHDPRVVRQPLPVMPSLVAGSTDVYSFVRPLCTSGTCNGQNGDQDWVLVLTDTNAGQPLWSVDPNADTLQTWTSFDPESVQWSIHGQIYDASGQPVEKGLVLSDTTTSSQRLPQGVRGSDGTYLVAWEAEEPDGDGSGIFGRLVTSSGTLFGGPLQLNQASEGRQIEPMVTSDGAGRFVVVWASTSQDGDGSGVVARRFSTAGEPLGEEFVVNTVTQGSQEAPLISADPAGDFVIGWLSYQPAERRESIVVQRFDTQARPVGGEIEIEASVSESLALERLDMDALGNFQVVWQRLHDGESQGHYAANFDRQAGLLGGPTYVAEPWE